MKIATFLLLASSFAAAQATQPLIAPAKPVQLLYQCDDKASLESCKKFKSLADRAFPIALRAQPGYRQATPQDKKAIAIVLVQRQDEEHRFWMQKFDWNVLGVYLGTIDLEKGIVTRMADGYGTIVMIADAPYDPSASYGRQAPVPAVVADYQVLERLSDPNALAWWQRGPRVQQQVVNSWISKTIQ